MSPRRYMILDVFSGEALEGNPLAVVLDAEGLDTGRMQRITREFNLSETVFVFPPENAAHTARVRIFAPEYEMPFAGHPTVGTAVALWTERGRGDGGIVVLEENIGPVRAIVRPGEGTAFAEFDVPRLPDPVSFDASETEVAAALGLSASDIGMPGHVVGAWSAGVPYVTVPLRGLDAMRRVRFDTDAWQSIAPSKDHGAKASAYLYCRETELEGSAFHARMMVASSPSYEDPATGSAAAAFVGTFMANERPADGSHAIWIEQGIEMGRPSRIRLEVDVKQGAATAARIGGEAVIVARGELYV